MNDNYGLLNRGNESWSVNKVQDGIDIFDGRMSLVVSNDGIIREVKTGRKYLVCANTKPMLRAVLIESKMYDECTDFIDDKVEIESKYNVDNVDYEFVGRKVIIRIQGTLKFSGGDNIHFKIQLSGQPGKGALLAEVSLKPDGEFNDRYIREISFHLPLYVNYRKRVAQGGSQGFTWNTRYFYQYHFNTKMKLLTEPECNEWRLLGVDQSSPVSYQLWKSESEHTAPLVMQVGKEAAGWISVFDEEGGMLFADRDMPRYAPKALRVHAWNHGEAIVKIHPDTVRAVGVYSQQATGKIFGVNHRIDLLFFEGEYEKVCPQVQLASLWGIPALASDPPVRLDDEMMIPYDERLTKHMSITELSPWITGGVALPQGKVKNPYSLKLYNGMRLLEYQTKPLAYWPDGSVKWLLLTFRDDIQAADANMNKMNEMNRIPFEVMFRDGSKRLYGLCCSPSIHGSHNKGLAANSIHIEECQGGFFIDTGPMQVELSLGMQWISRVVLKEREIVRSGTDRQPIAFVDFLRADEPYVAMTTHPPGEEDPGPVYIDQIDVVTPGPFRAVLCLKGEAKSKESPAVIIYLEFYAGRSFIKMNHTVEFSHKDPRKVFLRQMGIRLPVSHGEGMQETIFGSQGGPFKLNVNGLDKAGLCQENHMCCSIWRKKGNRLEEIEYNNRSRGWLNVSYENCGITAVIRNMWQEAPNELVADGRNGCIYMYFWPPSVPLMDMRRYSDFPHLSQGESVSDKNDWVEKVYYENDPVVGVSKTHELLLFFHDNNVLENQLDAVAADFQSPPLIYMGEAWYRENGILFPQPDPKLFPGITKNRDNSINFWLYHQKLFGWYSKWYYGNIRHRFNDGLGNILSVEDLLDVLALPLPERMAFSLSSKRIADYFPGNNWAFDNGRWGWGNTEGLPGLFFQQEYMRTGNREVFFMAEAIARYSRDVVTRHSGMWFGAGTRHGVQPWSDGNHEERQTIFSEFRYHYYLTGDTRSRDVARKLLEGHYLKQGLNLHASHSGRLYGLFTCWEMSGDPELGEIFRKYVQAFIVPEGICESPAVSFPGISVANRSDINGGSFFFHVFGAMHVLIEYYYLTQNAELKEALVKAAEALIQKGTVKYDNMLVISFAARHADDPGPFKAFIRKWFNRELWEYAFQSITCNSKHWAGETAFIKPQVPGNWFFMNSLPYFLLAMNEEPVLDSSQHEKLQQREKYGCPASPLPTSWQSEYDIPELEEYLGPWKPWAKKEKSDEIHINYRYSQD